MTAPDHSRKRQIPLAPLAPSIHGSCVIPFCLALRIDDCGDGAAWHSDRRDRDCGVVGHMRFLAQGENRLAAQERVEDPMSYRWRLRTSVLDHV
jgi:hypothetical protein